MHVALERPPLKAPVVASTPPGSDRAERVIASGLLLMHAGLAWLTRPSGVGTGQDDAVYLLLARALRDFRYEDLHFAGTPGHVLYPPGYPALLAMWGAVGSTRFDALVVLGILASVVSLGLVWLVLRGVIGRPLAILSLATLAVNPYLVTKSAEIAAEAPYMALSLLSLWLLAGEKEPGARRLMLTGLIAIAATLTRGVGVALLAALIVHWLLERRWRSAGILAMGGLATVGGWFAWTSRAPELTAGKSYLADAVHRGGGGEPAWIGEVLFGRVIDNVPAYLTVSLPYRLPIPTLEGTWVDNAAGALLSTAGLAVGTWVLWRLWRPAALYLIAYAGLLAVWPWQVGRFLIPLLPLLVPAVLLGLRELLLRMRPRWSTPAVVAIGLVLLANGSFRTAGELWDRRGCERGPGLPSPTCVGEDQASFFAGLRYIRTHLDGEALVLTAKPEPLFYYTGRQSIPMPRRMLESGNLLPELRESGVEHVLLGSLQAAEVGSLLNALKESCTALETTAFFAPRTYLFRVREEGSSSSGPNGCAAIEEYRRRNVGRDFERES